MPIIDLREYAYRKAAQTALNRAAKEGEGIADLCDAALRMSDGDHLAATDLLSFAMGSMRAEAQMLGLPA